MTTTDRTHAIAATEPRYTLLPVPGTELCEACPCCGSTAHTLPNCKTWAAGAGEPLIQSLRTQLDHLEHEAAALDALHTQAVDERDALQVALDLAHQHIGALVAHVPPRSGNAELEDTISAALTFLRRRI